MITISPDSVSTQQLQNYLGHAVAPRPICFASTIDRRGNVNVSPFSFFNQVSTNPPILVFSPSKRVRDNTHKHTYENVLEVPEVVINIVDYAMVQQVSLASTDYPKGVNEFNKAGFTAIPSEVVRPPRVAESPVQFECVVKEVISLGDGPGAGNIVVAEVKLIHYREDLIDAGGAIRQEKFDHVARLGGDWYARITPDSLFKVAKPLQRLGIGVDALPAAIRHSTVLTGNDLGKLGNVEKLPSEAEIEEARSDPRVKEILDATIGDPSTRTRELHALAQTLLDQGQDGQAWRVLLA